jgi:serine protease Do
MHYNYDDKENEYTGSENKPPVAPDTEHKALYERDNYNNSDLVVPLTDAKVDTANTSESIPIILPADQNNINPVTPAGTPDYVAVYEQSSSSGTPPADLNNRSHTAPDIRQDYALPDAPDTAFIPRQPNWVNRPNTPHNGSQNYIPDDAQVYMSDVPPAGFNNTQYAAQEGRQGFIPNGAQVYSPEFPSVDRNSIPYTTQNDTQLPNTAPHQQRMFAFRGYYQQGQPNYPPQDESWREPIYSQTHESVSNMYTPGIYVAQQYPHKRADTPQPEHKPKPKERTGLLSGFLRAACLVIICAAVSGLAAYAVTEGWFGLGSTRNSTINENPPIVNQVVLGGTNSNAQRSDNLTASIVPNGIGMPAEQIYTMACTQVVGINIELPLSAGRFGDGYGEQSRAAVSGSGFIISSDGYILTNYHVIEPANENSLPLVVTMHDGTEYNAKVIGYDKNYDVALIKIEATDLNAVLIANSDKVNVGQPVYAVGNPFGDLVYTMTEGIVSALDRIVTVDNKSIRTFQFSAAVNSGNSGGPVYDANGEVIGIVSAKIMGTSVEGIGFAIPINDAIDIASKLIADGYISGRPLMGITVNTVDLASAEYFSLVVGAHIRSTATGSAAEKAGLKVGDIITALGDSEIESMESLLFALRKFKAGETTTVEVWRAGQELNLTLTFDEDLSAGQPQRAQQEQPAQPQQPQRNDSTESPFTPDDQFIIPIPPVDRSEKDPTLPG